MTDAHGLMRDGLGISFGNDVSDDLELRICGDVRGKRVLELGIFGPMPNCVTLARKGARVTSVDTQRDTIQRAVKVLETANTPIAGVVFNGIKATARHYYYYYYYYDERAHTRRRERGSAVSPAGAGPA